MIRCYAFVKRLSQLDMPVLDIPILPDDYLSDVEIVEPFDFLKRALGLPLRCFGFAYPLGYQDVHNNNLTGSDILLAAHRQFGPVIQYQAAGNHMISINDPVLAKKVLSNLDKNTSSTAAGSCSTLAAYIWNKMSDAAPKSLVSMPSGDEHRKKRACFKASFHQAHILTQEKIIENLISKFKKTFNAAAESGEKVLLGNKFSSLAVEVICESALQFDLSKTGNHSNYLEAYAALADDLHVLLKSVSLVIAPPLLFALFNLPIWMLPFQFLREVKRSRSNLDKLVDKIYEHIMVVPEERVEKNSLIDALREYGTWPGVSKTHVCQEILLFFIAGHDTTVSSQEDPCL